MEAEHRSDLADGMLNGSVEALYEEDYNQIQDSNENAFKQNILLMDQDLDSTDYKDNNI